MITGRKPCDTPPPWREIHSSRQGFSLEGFPVALQTTFGLRADGVRDRTEDR